MKRTLKRLLCVLLTAMMTLSLASCGGKSDQQQGPQQTAQSGDSGGSQAELKELSISHHPVLSGLPAYVALQKGFFEQGGLDVDMTVYISGASQGSCSDFRGHEEGELFFCISGKGHIRLGNEVLPLEADSAIYVPPYVEHQTINDGGCGELRLLFALTPPFGGDRSIIEASKQKLKEDAHEGK